MDTRTRILNEAEALFKRRGVRSVTMDDIAKALRISKKTLYQLFANKGEIVYAVSIAHFDRERTETAALLESAQDPIDGILQVMQATAKSLKDIPSHMVYDICKYYPAAWQLFQAFKQGFVLEKVRENLQQGVKAGLYRKDMDIDLVALLRLVQIESSINETVFPSDKYDFAKVQMEQFSLFLHGIVTLRGKKLIYKYLNQPEDE